MDACLEVSPGEFSVHPGSDPGTVREVHFGWVSEAAGRNASDS